MKNLIFLIQEAFPTQFVSLKEIYETDEVGNVYCEYHLWVKDRFSEVFGNFGDLEKFVYQKHAEEAFHDARRIIEGKKRNEE